MRTAAPSFLPEGHAFPLRRCDVQRDFGPEIPFHGMETEGTAELLGNSYCESGGPSGLLGGLLGPL